MKKIISLFARNYEGDRLVRNEVIPGAEWVQAGEGVATRKFDGTCCMVRGGDIYKRFDAKAGKAPPANFEPAQEPDKNTGHWPGWVPVGDGPEDARHREALANFWRGVDLMEDMLIGEQLTEDEVDSKWNELIDGTYELCGPKVQSNPEKFSVHQLERHGDVVLNECPRTFHELREYLATNDIEGVVWHHSDGRMVKIRGRDFGLKRP